MSSRNMTLNQIKAVDSKFGANHTVKVSGFKDGGKGGPNKPRTSKPPKYFLEFQKQMFEFIQEQREFNKMILDRFDNLVIKNNLKE